MAILTKQDVRKFEPTHPYIALSAHVNCKDNPMKVQVYDGIMGVGKSSMAIEYVKEHPENFYFIVLPYLNEVDRYRNDCNTSLSPDNQLIDPSDEDGTKSDHLLSVLKHRQGSIATTHSMLENLNSSHLSSLTNLPLKRGEKVLILDETIDLVKPVNSDKLPKEALQADIENEYIIVNETTGVVKWNTLKDFSAQYPHHTYLKGLCETGMLYFLDNIYIVMEVPMGFLQCFDRVMILTYRWSFSIMANYLHVNGHSWELVNMDADKTFDCYKYISENLIIPDDFSLAGLSKSKMRQGDMSSLKKSLNKSIKESMSTYNVKLENMLFTTLRRVDEHDMVEWYKSIKVGKWQRMDAQGRVEPVTFLSHTTLGTNEYAHCELMIYGLSKHIHPGIHSYFSKRDHSMPGDGWALSSMLQWLFRGCIRDRNSNKDMVAVILCPRMRRMAQNWLASITRQVKVGEVETSGDMQSMCPSVRRSKVQQYKQWCERNIAAGKMYTFEEYMKYGGPTLKRMAKEVI